jgi:hypothetical protein
MTGLVEHDSSGSENGDDDDEPHSRGPSGAASRTLSRAASSELIGPSTTNNSVSGAVVRGGVDGAATAAMGVANVTDIYNTVRNTSTLDSFRRWEGGNNFVLKESWLSDTQADPFYAKVVADARHQQKEQAELLEQQKQQLQQPPDEVGDNSSENDGH